LRDGERGSSSSSWRTYRSKIGTKGYIASGASYLAEEMNVMSSQSPYQSRSLKSPHSLFFI
jgi:hypothetical protein